MTVQGRNEAAELLKRLILDIHGGGLNPDPAAMADYVGWKVDDIRRAERRATLATVNDVLDQYAVAGLRKANPDLWDALRRAILDEEAAR